MQPFMTKNNLLLDMSPQPNGQKIRTLIDPKSNQIVSQSPVNGTLRNKAISRRHVGRRSLVPRQSQDMYGQT